MAEYTFKTWESGNTYTIYTEFNRIEKYNEYCKKWLNDYYNLNISFTSKINWTYKDIIDIKDFNRLKQNINILLEALNIESKINVTTQANQTFNTEKANELENKLKEYLTKLGQWQFMYNVTRMTRCGGNNLKLAEGN